MDESQLLAEIEDLLRSMPPRATLREPTDENFGWFGRARALINAWDKIKGISFAFNVDQFLSRTLGDGESIMLGIEDPFPKILTVINEARFNLRMRTVGPFSVVVDRGKAFDYFDEIRKIIQTSQSDLFFVDPYADADFVSRYLPHVREGVSVRILTSQYLPKLLPAVDLFVQQTDTKVKVRRPRGKGHDRYVFVDGCMCYFSSSSFKDGARLSPSMLWQVTDLFSDTLKVYETEWSTGAVER